MTSGIRLGHDCLSICIPWSNFSKNRYLLLENSSKSGLANKEDYFLLAINCVLCIAYLEGINLLEVNFTNILVLESPIVINYSSRNCMTG